MRSGPFDPFDPDGGLDCVVGVLQGNKVAVELQSFSVIRVPA